VDAALFLLSPKGEENTGCPLRFLGGESSGAYLAVQTAIRLRDKGINVRERLAGLIPTYGLYDLSELPTARFMRGPIDPHVDFLAIALPKEVRTSMDLIKHPKWSPLYADLKDLPPASFSVGTEDGLIDDTLLMAARWELAGNEAELFLYPGTTHGYLTMVRLDATEEALRDIAQFVERQLAATGST
jgi:acetyl esterase/lipase